MRVIPVAEAVERIMVRRPVRKEKEQPTKGRKYKPAEAQRKKFMKQPSREDVAKNEKLRALAASRRARGLPPTIPTPWKGYTYERWGLQVRSDRFPTWGTIAARSLGEGTEELEKLKTGWMLNAYFGYDAQYRIVREKGHISDQTY